MNKKMECIRNLKTKLLQMQKQLQRVEKKAIDIDDGDSRLSQQKSWFHKTVNFTSYKQNCPQMALSKNPSWKNPNYWGSNPITGKQNYTISPSKWIKEKPNYLRRQQRSPQIKQIKNRPDKKYFSNKNQTKQEDEQQNPNRYSCSNLSNQKEYHSKSKRYLYSFHGLQRQTPRFEKIKTFDQPIKNPILNPEKQQQKGIKIVKKPSLASNIDLIQNPKSNPNVYCFGQKFAYLSPKNNNRKNLSPSIKQLLSSSLQEKVTSPKRRSCKKHFAKYFTQNFQSKWD